MPNQYKNPLALITLTALSSSALTYFIGNKNHKVLLPTNNFVDIPPTTSRLGLLGCTPHPTVYLKNFANATQRMLAIEKIDISDFLDIDYLKDSFTKTFLICKDQQIDHLVMAYLPIYFVDMQILLENDFLKASQIFLAGMKSQITPLIDSAAKTAGFTGSFQLVLPTAEQIQETPKYISSQDQRTAFLVRHFPYFDNLKNSQVKTLVIINNSPPSEIDNNEDNDLITLFRFIYLTQKELTFEQYGTGKTRFHKTLT